MSGAQRILGGDAPTRSGALMFAFLGGLTAWLADVVASWALVPISCNAGVSWPLHAVAAVAALVAAVALAVGLAASRRLDSETSGSRPAFMARVGVGLNALALLVIAFMWLLLAWLDPCTGDQEFPLWLY
ncbi:MAG: hypothetical protein KY433_06665 [Actinobacteria bacterium]|nr:hypothetical protein [Actinomycetota bacterium]